MKHGCGIEIILRTSMFKHVSSDTGSHHDMRRVYRIVLFDVLASPEAAGTEPMETDVKVEKSKNESDETGKKKKKKRRNITWATDDRLVEYHYYEPDDEERGEDYLELYRDFEFRGVNKNPWHMSMTLFVLAN